MSPLDLAVLPLHAAVAALAAALTPTVDALAVPLALVVLTLLVRLGCLPLAVRLARSDRARRALQPRLDLLMTRHRDDPQRLAAEVSAAHREAGVRPLAALVPAFIASGVTYLVYRLCVSASVAGAPNVVAAAHLFGAPLASHAVAVLAAGGVPAIAVGVLMLLLVVGAWASGVQAVRRMRVGAGQAPGAPTLAIARVLPFTSVAVAVVAPVAVSLYLVASTAWVLAERAALSRLIG